MSMKTENSGGPASPQDNHMVPVEGTWGTEADWGSWIDPDHARDSLRVDTIEALRSELRMRPKTSHPEPDSFDDGPDTVNARLQTRVRDLSRENSDMNNMVAGTGIATVFLDRQLRVVRVTPAANQTVNLTVDSIGRPVSGIASSPIGYDQMVAAARSVLDTLRSKRVDVQAGNGRWYQMHIHPYRTVDATIEGVVISFFDITEARRAEQEIARQLAEKETLLKEVHHRVRNNTASIAGLLSIQAQSIVAPEARAVLQGAIGRVESMSVLYDRLLVSEQYGASSVKDYLESLADSVMALSLDESNITLEKHIDDFDLESGNLFLIGLITNELLTNVMSFAFSSGTGGLITLTLKKSGNRVTLIVQDDGVGLPPGFDPMAADGFGLTLVRMLSEQLGGNFSISNQDGTRSVLEFAL